MITRHKIFKAKSYSRQMGLVFMGLAFLITLATLSAESGAGQQSAHPRPGGLLDIEIPGPNTKGFDMSGLVQGSVTIFGERGAIKLNCERVADRVFMAAPVGGTGKAVVAPAKGEGSEIRYAGKGTINSMSFDVPPGYRLCFRKSEDGWVYICGKGTLSGSVKAVFGKKLGPQQILTLLASDSPFDRESGARNGHLLPSGPNQYQKRIVEKLRHLLADRNPVLFSAAAEGLAYIGSNSAFEILIAAGKAEGRTEQQQEIISESLALLASRRLFLGVGSASISEEEAARLVLSAQKPWVRDCVAERMQREASIRRRVSALTRHASPDVKKLALEIQASAGGGK